MKLPDPREHRVEPDVIGVVHWPATPGREAITVDVHDIDIARTLRNAFLDNFHALIDQRINEPIDDFLGIDVAPQNAERLGLALDDHLNFRIGCFRSRVRVIPIKSSAAFLSEMPGLDEHICNAVRPGVTALVFGQGLASPVADIEPGKICDADRSHRHAPVGHRGIDRLGRAALDQAELRLAEIRPEHAIADKAVTDA